MILGEKVEYSQNSLYVYCHKLFVLQETLVKARYGLNPNITDKTTIDFYSKNNKYEKSRLI